MGKSDTAAKTRSGRNEIIISFSALFLFTFAYFSIFGSFVFSYQEKQVLFTYSSDYLDQFLSRPGGLLVYAGNFFTQFFYDPLAGSSLLGLHIALLAAVSYFIITGVSGRTPMTIPFSLVLPCLSILLQSDYNIPIYYTEGLLIVAAFYLVLVQSSAKVSFVLIAGFPLLYYVTGAFSWIFALIYILHNLAGGKFPRAVMMFLVATSSYYISQAFIFYQTQHDLLAYPLILYSRSYIFYIACLVLALFPVILKIFRTEIFRKAEGNISPYISLVIFSITVFVLSRMYNPEIPHLFRLEKMVQDEKWDEVIRYQEEIQSKNIVAQYYYNLALSETDQLCDRLFAARQDFGPASLMVQWDSKLNINQIFRGAYFFYSVGLINEAHRWAFESMVMQGNRPENMKMLVKTELIRGNFAVAAKYLAVLKRTYHYRKFALEYQKFLQNPDLIARDPRLGQKVRMKPATDFLVRISAQQDNVPLLLKSCPSNRRAFEYMMAWFMLERKPEKVAEEIYRADSIPYTRMPKHIAEALFLQDYRSGALNNNDEADKGMLKKYEDYRNASGRMRESGINKAVRSTFWYYMDSK